MLDPAHPNLTLHLADGLRGLDPAAVLVAFSGGADSTALLLTAAAFFRNLPLRALHVNHHCSRHAGAWQRHCENVAKRLGIELVVLKVPIGQLAPDSSETVMRSARYQLLESALDSGEVLLMAHHLDDQAEGSLLALMRGGSMQEMAGAPARRRLGRGWIVRPFLGCCREQLEQCVVSAGLDWVKDPANQDLRHPRSTIRHQVLPLLGRHWPEPAQRIAATARRLQHAARALAEAIDEIIGDVDIVRSLPLSLILRRNPPLALAILRHWLALNDAAQPNDRALRELLRQASATDHDSALALAVGGQCIRRFRDRLWLVEEQPHPGPDVAVTWDSAEQSLPATLGRMRWLGGAPQAPAWPSLEVRFAVPGTTMRLAGQSHRRPLKKLFQEAGIPPWERLRTPLVFHAGEAAMIGNLFKSDAMRELERQLGAQAQWQRLDQPAVLG